MSDIILIIEVNLGEYQCGFRKGRSTIEQISVIGQIIYDFYRKEIRILTKPLSNIYKH